MKYIFSAFCLIFCFGINAQDFEGTVNQGSLIGLTTADFNGDGHMDVAGRNGANLILHINDGASDIGFTENTIDPDLDLVWLLSSADLDADGDVDIIVAATDEYNVYALMNDGTGIFTVNDLGLAGTHQHKIDDLDNDGDMDIVGMDVEKDIIQIYENDGSMNFSQVYSEEYDNDLTTFSLGKLDDNESMDIIIGYDEFSDTQIEVLYNDGNNGFSPTVIVTNELRLVRRVLATDIDNDNHIDILSLTEFNCVAWLNDGNMNFSRQDLFEHIAPTASNFYRHLALGDYNRDSRMDILVGDNSDDLLWYKNLGNFNYERRVVGGSSPVLSFANADLDNDGDLDIVGNSFSFFWYENLVPMDTIDTHTLDLKPINELNTFPNPTTGKIIFENLDNDQYDLQIFSAIGTLIHTDEVLNSNYDLSHLPQGAYFLKVSDKADGVQFISKVILIEE